MSPSVCSHAVVGKCCSSSSRSGSSSSSSRSSSSHIGAVVVAVVLAEAVAAAVEMAVVVVGKNMIKEQRGCCLTAASRDSLSCKEISTSQPRHAQQHCAVESSLFHLMNGSSSNSKVWTRNLNRGNPSPINGPKLPNVPNNVHTKLTC